MGFMDVFSEQGGSAPTGDFAVQSKTFTWDSATDGNITDPTTWYSLGTFGTAGKKILTGRVRMRSTNVVTGATGGVGNFLFSISDQLGNNIWFFYQNDNTQDPLTTDGWQTPVSAFDTAQVPLYHYNDAGTGPQEVGIVIVANAGTWDMSGKIDVVVEWVEFD